MPDVNGMSSFNAAPESINPNVGVQGDVETVHDPYSGDMLSYHDWLYNDELNKEYFGHVLSDGVRQQLQQTGLSAFINWIGGTGPQASKGYDTYTQKWDQKNSVASQVAQYQKLGISPYMLVDSGALSSSTSYSPREKRNKNDDSASLARLFGVMLLAIARVAASAI